MKNKLRVGILMGGISNEREVSLKSGEQVFNNLSRDHYIVRAIEISKNGVWILDKKKTLRLFPHNDLKKYVDVVFIALHGAFGEDGKVQAILDTLQIPYTGSGVLASALGMNKTKTSELVTQYKILTPKSFLIHKNNYSLSDLITTIEQKISFPCVVKPNASGSSVGVSIVRNKKELPRALDKAFKEDTEIVIQQYIEGRELTCAVIGNTNQTELTSLPPIEIVSPGTFFDYNAKYLSKKTQEICPAPIDSKISNELIRLSKKVHLALGCDELTRSDFILSKKDNKLYFLEINTIPGITKTSLCPKAAKAANISFSEFLDIQINLALNKYTLHYQTPSSL